MFYFSPLYLICETWGWWLDVCFYISQLLRRMRKIQGHHAVISLWRCLLAPLSCASVCMAGRVCACMRDFHRRASLCTNHGARLYAFSSKHMCRHLSHSGLSLFLRVCVCSYAVGFVCSSSASQHTVVSEWGTEAALRKHRVLVVINSPHRHRCTVRISVYSSLGSLICVCSRLPELFHVQPVFLHSANAFLLSFLV